MAEKILIFKSRSYTTRVTYDEDLKRVSDVSVDLRSGQSSQAARQARLNETDIPGFLDPGGKLDNEPAAGDDLYIHTEGDVIYYVRAREANPEPYVVSEFYRELTYEQTEDEDVSAFGEEDGRFRYELRHGSGYIYAVYYTSYGAGVTVENDPTPGEPAVKRFTIPLGESAAAAGTYQHVFRDALTFKEFIFEFEVEQPTCDLLIEEVAVSPESADGANDGSVTVTATSTNNVEYRLDTGAWQDSNVFSGLADGTYTLQVRDKNQPKCIQSQSVIVEELICDLSIDEVRAVPESFLGAEDGRFTVLATTEREGGIQHWLTRGGPRYGSVQDSNIFVDLPSGPYGIHARLKAANQCQDEIATRHIVRGGDHQVEITHVFCGNSPTGRIELSVDPSYPFDDSLLPLSYRWSRGGAPTGSEGSVLENAVPGDYTVDITTADGRTQQQSYTITGQPPIEITANVDQGDVFLSVNGGEAPYTFEWSDGATSQNRSGLAADTYIVTVTDNRGCSKQQNIFVRIPQHYFSQNKIALEVFAFDLEAKPNFTYVCEIYLEEEYLSDEFSKIGELEHSVDEEGKTVFEVQDFLDAYLEPVLPDVHAAASTGGLVRLDSQFKRFYLRFTEKFGEEPALSTFSQQETFYVLLGGLSFEEYSTKDFFVSYLPEQRPFYTWQPAEKEVFPDQPEFLHYLCNQEDLAEFRVWMRLFYEDSTTAEYMQYSAFNPAQYELFRFPAGYQQLSVEGHLCQAVSTGGATPKQCYQYELYITDGNNVQISETRRYLVNRDYYEHKNYFFFLNSLGGYDTLVATGRARYQLGIDEETVNRRLPHDYLPTDRSVEVLQKSGEPEVMQPVGYPTKETMLALQDFALSQAYYQYKEGRLIPITVNIRRTTVVDENENLQELEFTYALPRMDKYTPKLKTVPIVSELTAEAIDNNGILTLQAEGGTPPYEYRWVDQNNGDAHGEVVSNQPHSDRLPGGTYQALVRDNSQPPQAVSLCGLVVPESQYISWELEEPSYESVSSPFFDQPPGYQTNLDHFYGLHSPDSTSYTSGTTSFIGLQPFEPGPTGPGTYELSLYVYFPAAMIGRYDGFGGYTDLRLHTSYGDETHLATGDIDLRDQWQELKSTFVVTETQNRQMRINLSRRIDAPQFYFSDITIRQL